MLGINDLKKGSLIVINREPYRVMLVKHSHMGRGSATLQAKIVSLVSGKIFERGFKPADEFDEAEIEKMDSEFIYARDDEYWFHEAGNPAHRFSLSAEAIGEQRIFMKPKMPVRAFKFNEEIINVELPIKADFKVTEAPPNVRGNTAQGGTKQVVIETGARVSTPMFVETGDTIRVNTETGEYVERA
ncbi:MAG: elongation factor P [Candidatus Colwellbacteria bacterium]|nr:elongation factor P [Candidatus Colwellbacteria bacterium]